MRRHDAIVIALYRLNCTLNRRSLIIAIFADISTHGLSEFATEEVVGLCDSSVRCRRSSMARARFVRIRSSCSGVSADEEIGEQ